MNFDRARSFLLGLPHVAEAEQFGGLIYWLGNKAIGGRMCAHMNVGPEGYRISFPAGPERFHELLEREGLAPAPYLARAHWVAAERWHALRDPEWEAELRAAHARTSARLPARTRRLLEGPAAERKRAIAEGERKLAEKRVKQ